MIYFFLLNFLVIFSIIISTYFNISIPPYYFLSIILTAYYLISYKSRKLIKFQEVYSLIFYIAIFISLFILELIFGVLPNILVSLKSVLSLTWIPLFLLIFFNRIKNFDFEKFINFQIFVGLVVSVLGIIQYFFSRDLWGFIPRIRLDSFYDNMDISYRASSVLYSEQVFGLFCVLSAILVLEFNKLFKRQTVILLILIFTFSGLLSGNKSVTFLIAVYAFIKLIFFSKKNWFILVMQIVIFISILVLVLNHLENDTVIRTFTWFFNKDGISSVDSNNSRYLIYSDLIRETNIILGNGVGSTMSSNNDNYINTESYYLQLYSEGGIILLGAFLYFNIRLLKYFYRIKDMRLFNLLIIILCSMIFVHAFGSPVFIGFWTVILAPLFTQTLRLSK